MTPPPPGRVWPGSRVLPRLTLPHPIPRIPLSLNPEKGLWNQNQLANSSPAPGKPLSALYKCYNMVSLSLGWDSRSPA